MCAAASKGKGEKGGGGGRAIAGALDLRCAFERRAIYGLEIPTGGDAFGQGWRRDLQGS
jgi:hypothetical protein